MLGYLKRLITTGAAYQFGDIVAKGLALITLPLYTHHLSPEAYGAAETLLTAVILSSILLRVGIGEAFIRFYFDDTDIARRSAGMILSEKRLRRTHHSPSTTSADAPKLPSRRPRAPWPANTTSMTVKVTVIATLAPDANT